MDSNITLQTKQMIDSLKAVCTNFGLGNASSEYKIITEVFLYKFLNDKFLFEAKRVEPALAKLSPADAEKQLAQMTDDDYELFLLGFGPDTAKLKQTHFISYLFNRKNEENFHTVFDDTLLDIATYNIIKNSTDVPYYLTESYTDKKYKPDPPKKGKTVQAFHIYTRVMDNNTPIDKSADIRDVEYLWKKRFGLLQTPLEQVKILLRKPDEWAEEDSRYYHKLFPQYTISIEYEEDEDGISKEGNRVFYHHLQTDTRTQYGVLKIYHYSTQLFSCQITELDGHRMTAPCPETKYIPYRNYSDPNICLRYYVTSDFLYLLLRFLEYHIGNANGNEAQYATRRLLDVVLLFDSNEDAEDFATYIHRHLGTFDSKVLEQREPYIANETDMAAKALAQEIRNSQALKEMQPEWELFRLENA